VSTWSVGLIVVVTYVIAYLRGWNNGYEVGVEQRRITDELNRKPRTWSFLS
jgi:hypothetical protein